MPYVQRYYHYHRESFQEMRFSNEILTDSEVTVSKNEAPENDEMTQTGNSTLQGDYDTTPDSTLAKT